MQIPHHSHHRIDHPFAHAVEQPFWEDEIRPSSPFASTTATASSLLSPHPFARGSVSNVELPLASPTSTLSSGGPLTPAEACESFSAWADREAVPVAKTQGKVSKAFSLLGAAIEGSKYNVYWKSMVRRSTTRVTPILPRASSRSTRPLQQECRTPPLRVSAVSLRARSERVPGAEGGAVQMTLPSHSSKASLGAASRESRLAQQASFLNLHRSRSYRSLQEPLVSPKRGRSLNAGRPRDCGIQTIPVRRQQLTESQRLAQNLLKHETSPRWSYRTPWHSKHIVLTAHTAQGRSLLLLHCFETDQLNEDELDRLELTERSVVCVTDELHDGKLYVLKITGTSAHTQSSAVWHLSCETSETLRLWLQTLKSALADFHADSVNKVAKTPLGRLRVTQTDSRRAQQEADIEELDVTNSVQAVASYPESSASSRQESDPPTSPSSPLSEIFSDTSLSSSPSVWTPVSNEGIEFTGRHSMACVGRDESWLDRLDALEHAVRAWR